MQFCCKIWRIFSRRQTSYGVDKSSSLRKLSLVIFFYISKPVWLSVLKINFKHDYIMPHTYFGIVLENENSDNAFLTTHPVFEIDKPTNKSWLLGINTEEGQQKALGEFFKILYVPIYYV